MLPLPREIIILYMKNHAHFFVAGNSISDPVLQRKVKNKPDIALRRASQYQRERK